MTRLAHRGHPDLAPRPFVDVPAGIKILVAAGVLWTLAFTVLILSPAKRG